MMALFHKHFYLFVLCLMLGLNHAHAYNNTGRLIDSTTWRQITSEKSFGYKNEVETPPAPKEYKQSALDRILEAFYKFLKSGAGSVFLWILIVGLVLYVLYKIYVSNESIMFSRGKKILAVSVKDNVDDITATNWEAMLQKALKENNMKSAVKCCYMWMLQLLQNKELIHYRIDKTNYEYYVELENTNIKQPFRKLSMRYEYVWYGEYAVTQDEFNAYMDLFKNMRSQIG